MFNIAIILGVFSILLQGLVIYYGIKLFTVVGKTEYWSMGWSFYVLGNLVILFRRLDSFYTLVFDLCNNVLLKHMIIEGSLAIGVSILFLLFGKFLSRLFGKYVFKPNGIISERVEVQEVKDVKDLEAHGPKKVIIDIEEKKVMVQDIPKVVIVTKLGEEDERNSS